MQGRSVLWPLLTNGGSQRWSQHSINTQYLALPVLYNLHVYNTVMQDALGFKFTGRKISFRSTSTELVHFRRRERFPQDWSWPGNRKFIFSYVNNMKIYHWYTQSSLFVLFFNIVACKVMWCGVGRGLHSREVIPYCNTPMHSISKKAKAKLGRYFCRLLITVSSPHFARPKLLLSYTEGIAILV